MLLLTPREASLTALLRCILRVLAMPCLYCSPHVCWHAETSGRSSCSPTSSSSFRTATPPSLPLLCQLGEAAKLPWGMHSLAGGITLLAVAVALLSKAGQLLSTSSCSSCWVLETGTAALKSSSCMLQLAVRTCQGAAARGPHLLWTATPAGRACTGSMHVGSLECCLTCVWNLGSSKL